MPDEAAGRQVAPLIAIYDALPDFAPVRTNDNPCTNIICLGRGLNANNCRGRSYRSPWIDVGRGWARFEAAGFVVVVSVAEVINSWAPRENRTNMSFLACSEKVDKTSSAESMIQLGRAREEFERMGAQLKDDMAPLNS